jgi:tetratricopeptide (TPR) repeat protein
MDTVRCPNCGRVRKKKFAKFCEACGVSFCKEIQTASNKDYKRNNDHKTRGKQRSNSYRTYNVEFEKKVDISPKAKKFIAMAAYELAINELEKQLKQNRSVKILHALSMCYLCKCGGIKDSFDFTNWFTAVIGVFSFVEKSVKIGKAERYISEALELEPENNILYKTLALCKYTRGNYEQALKIGKAISKEADELSEIAGSQIFIGNCFRQLGNVRAYENRMQYAAFILNDNQQLTRQIEEMKQAQSMLFGGAALAGYLLAGPLGGALGAAASSVFQGASDQRQFEDNDPEIIEFIRMRDERIRLEKIELEKRREKESMERFSCFVAIVVGLILGARVLVAFLERFPGNGG